MRESRVDMMDGVGLGMRSSLYTLPVKFNGASWSGSSALICSSAVTTAVPHVPWGDVTVG